MTRDYRSLILPDEPSLVEVLAAVPDYRAICLTVLRAVLDRFEARPDYPFVDTKLDLTSGRDFAVDDPIRGLEAVYGWIQGRGLEALAGHGRWLRETAADDAEAALLPRIEDMLRAVLRRVSAIRERNGGHLFFLMHTDGTPLFLDDAGVPTETTLSTDAPWNFSDLFASKGMLAAARFLEDEPGAVEEALQYCVDVDEAICSGDFVTDQQPLDPANPVRPVEGKFSHGARMISLGAVAVRARAGDPDAVAAGLRLLEFELENHLAVPGGDFGQLEPFDFWEAIDADGQPYREADGAIICDPGHALEFAGLASNMTRSLRLSGPVPAAADAALSAAEALVPGLVSHIFELGFQPAAGGICKTVDLVSRRPLNTDMPWWNLPETMRAAAYCCELSDDEDAKRSALRILAACHNAFTRHYVRPDVHLMAVQTRSLDGSVSSAIPATADADPGYHTGLSLIDLMETLQRLTE